MLATGRIVLVVGIAVLLRLPYELSNRLVSFPVPPTRGMAVVVTGTSSGIGQHAALHLDAMGVTVYSGVRKQSDADALVALRPSLRPVIMDIGDEASVKAAVDLILRNASGDALDICALVNNAGIGSKLPLELVSEETANKVLSVNVLGAVRVTNALLPALRRCNSAAGGGARVVNIGSVQGKIAVPYRGMYSASKHALEGLSDAYRYELQAQNISVSIIEPGYVQSKIAEKNSGSNAPWAYLEPEQAQLFERFYGGRQRFERLEAEFYEKIWSKASPSITSTEAIVDAIFSPNPKTRYACATTGVFSAWFVVNVVRPLIPDRLLDKMMRGGK